MFIQELLSSLFHIYEWHYQQKSKKDINSYIFYYQFSQNMKEFEDIQEHKVLYLDQQNTQYHSLLHKSSWQDHQKDLEMLDKFEHKLLKNLIPKIHLGSLRQPHIILFDRQHINQRLGIAQHKFCLKYSHIFCYKVSNSKHMSELLGLQIIMDRLGKM